MKPGKNGNVQLMILIRNTMAFFLQIHLEAKYAYLCSLKLSPFYYPTYKSGICQQLIVNKFA